uniref:p18 n=1 Tax=Carnation necrotic fleck virus TaxID=551454 RepID=A0A4P2X6K2_9CLOS|nr:p18 [Carnation necrotic fleck virus]
MKLYFTLAFYTLYSASVDSLLTKAESNDQSDESAVRVLIKEYTELCTKLLSLKSDVNDARRDEGEEVFTAKSDILLSIEKTLCTIRDVLRVKVINLNCERTPEETLVFLASLYSETEKVSFDETLELKTRDVVANALKVLSKKWCLDITTTPFKFVALLKLNCTLRSTFFSYLGKEFPRKNIA